MKKLFFVFALLCIVFPCFSEVKRVRTSNNGNSATAYFDDEYWAESSIKKLCETNLNILEQTGKPKDYKVTATWIYCNRNPFYVISLWNCKTFFTIYVDYHEKGFHEKLEEYKYYTFNQARKTYDQLVEKYFSYINE